MFTEERRQIGPDKTSFTCENVPFLIRDAPESSRTAILLVYKVF